MSPDLFLEATETISRHKEILSNISSTLSVVQSMMDKPDAIMDSVRAITSILYSTQSMIEELLKDLAIKEEQQEAHDRFVESSFAAIEKLCKSNFPNIPAGYDPFLGE